MGAIATPLVGAIIIWRCGGRFRRGQRWLAIVIFAIVGLLALTLFLLNRYHACAFAPNGHDCLFDALATLSLCALGTTLAAGGIVRHDTSRPRDDPLVLLLVAGCAGIGLAENLLVLILALNLFLFAGHRWLNKRGYQPRFLVLHDDYKDDHGPQ